MSKKKSYMNKKNILTEGWLTDIIKKITKDFKTFKNKASQKDQEVVLTKDKGFLSALLDLNKSAKRLEDRLTRVTGKKVKLNRYKLGDFIK